jgi:hypothetical protein
MKPAPIFLNKKAWLFLSILALLPLNVYAAAARVEFAIGNATAVGANGTARPLTKGLEINPGDTVQTSGNGRAQLRFSDGGYISLQPNTQFRVDEYSFDGKTDGNEKSFFSLVKGVLRAITGAIGHVNKTNYQVKTPVATIGIRGTEFLAQYNGKLLVKVGNGAVYMSNATGDLVLFSGQSGEVANENSQPEYSNEEPTVTAAGPQGNTPDEVQQQAQQEQQQSDTFKVAEQYTESGTSCVVVGSCPVTDTAAPTAFKTLTNQAIALVHYNDEPGYENRGVLESAFPSSIEFDSSGRIIRVSGPDGSFSVSNITGDFLDTGSDGALTWTRLNGGTVLVSDEDGTDTASITNAHFIYGNPTSASDMDVLRTNQAYASYDLVGGTRPTNGSGQVGSLVDGYLDVYFSGSYDVYGYIKVSMLDSGDIHAYGDGNIIANTSQFKLDGGVECAPHCLHGIGFFAGSGAQQAGMSYYIASPDNNQITGTAAFVEDESTRTLTEGGI